MSGNVRRNLAVQLTAGGTSPLVLKAKGVLPFKMGTAVNMALKAQGGTAPYAYSISAGALPRAATFTASISTTTMTVSAVANGTIYVGMPVNGTGVTAGQTVVSFGTGTGGTGTYNVGISNTLTSRAMTGTLLLAAATGIITGTPSVAGAYTFTAQVQDANSTIFTGTFEMPVQHLLVGSAIIPPDDVHGFGASYQFAVSGATGAVTWSGGPGGGLHFTFTSGGLLTWDTNAGSVSADTLFQYNVTATDAGSGDSVTFPIAQTIYKNIFASVIPLTTNAVIGATTTINYPSLVSLSGGKAPYTFYLVSPPFSWVTITSSGNLVISPPANTASSNVLITVKVVDSTSFARSNTFAIIIHIVNSQNVLQPQQSSSNVGAAGASNLNFSGIGAASVANDGTTATVTLGANMNAPTTDVTIPANSTASVIRKFTIASGTKLTIGSGAIFKIE